MAIYGESGSAPQSVVKFGKEMLKNDRDYDYVFFVFDRDQHTGYREAIDSIAKLGSSNRLISAITSNPCFEIWFLMHFFMCTKPFVPSGSKSSCDNVISELKQFPGFADYKKGGKKHEYLLENKREDAIRNSSRAYRIMMDGRSANETKHDLNPLTLVHELVKVLEEMAEKQNRT